jgi:cytochrome P450
MTAVTHERVEVLRPRKGGPIAALNDAVVVLLRNNVDLIGRVLRVLCPICNVCCLVIVTRNDDVREVLLDNVHFNVEQTPRLNREMDNAPFMLGLDDQAAFDRNVAPLRDAVRSSDIPGLGRKCGERTAKLVDEAAGGRLEVVDLIRQVTFEVFCDYIGVTTAPAGQDLRIVATRIYEFQVNPFKDRALTREALTMARALRRHIDGVIAAPGAQKDDVLHRLLAYQASHDGLPTDAEIRAHLLGLIVALTQLPIAAPEALDQLLARPDELQHAIDSAGANDDTTLAEYIFEAARFDPMAPYLLRRCVKDHEIASGTRRATTIKKGKIVVAGLQSAMKDPRRVAEPETFNPGRAWTAYLTFGHGLHTCFAEAINREVVPAILKSLLVRDGLVWEGRLKKRGFFADQLWVKYSPRRSPLAGSMPAHPELEPA